MSSFWIKLWSPRPRESASTSMCWKSYKEKLSIMGSPSMTGSESENDSTNHATSEILRIQVDRPVYNRKTFDAEFATHPSGPLKSCYEKTATKYKAACTPKNILGQMLMLVPFVETVHTYQWRRDIGMDLLAGISVSMVHIPQGMGFALLAAVAPVYGLYASFWQVLMYTVFGHCRHLSIGTMAVISLIIGAVVEREVVVWKTLIGSGATSMTTEAMLSGTQGVTASAFVMNSNNSASEQAFDQAEGLTEEDIFRSSVACGVSLIAGITMLAMGIFQLGAITKFMPKSFIAGFTTGTAFHITTTQLKPLLNVSVKRFGGMFNLPLSIFEILKAIPSTNIPDFIITLITFSFLVIIKEVINIRYRKKLKIPVPAEMIVVVVVTILSFAIGFHERWDVKIVGFIPRGIPGPVMPNLERASYFALDGVVAGVTSFAISISMVDILSTKHNYQMSANRELVAYGLTYGLSSFLHCFVGAAAPPRCFVTELNGGKTQMANVFTAIILLLILMVIAPVFKYLPNASLACIIVVALFPLFKQFSSVPRIWRISKPDFIIWVVTFVVCVFVDVSVSLGVGIFVAILSAVIPSINSKGYLYGYTPYADLLAPMQTHSNLSQLNKIVVFRYESTLYFVTIQNFKKELYKAACEPTPNINVNQNTNNCKNLEVMIGVALDKQNKTKPITLLKNKEKKIQGIVLDCSTFCYVDLMALDTLKELSASYDKVGIRFVLADCNPNLICKLTQAGFLDVENPTIEVFPTVQDAVATLSSDTMNTTFIEQPSRSSDIRKIDDVSM